MRFSNICPPYAGNPILLYLFSQVNSKTCPPEKNRKIAFPRAAGGRVTMKERNVLGTMQLLAAAYHAPDLRRLVLEADAALLTVSGDRLLQ